MEFTKDIPYYSEVKNLNNMRTASTALMTFLATAKKATIVDLYTFTLIDGSIYRYCTGQIDVVSEGHTYSSSGLLIKRNGIRLSRGVQVDALELEIYPDGATIGGIPWLAAVRNGALDGAQLKLERLFCSNWATPVGLITLFVGTVGVITLGRSAANVKVVSMFEKFNIQWPYNVYTPACGWELYGTGCGLNKVDFTVQGSVIEGSTTSIIQTTNSFIHPDAEKVEVNAVSSVFGKTVSHTVGSAANRILIVGASFWSRYVDVTGVKYGDAPFIKLGDIKYGENKTSIWYLLSPQIGTADIVVTPYWDMNVVFGAISLYNVDQTNPFRNTATGGGTGATAYSLPTIVTEVGDLVLAVLTSDYVLYGYIPPTPDAAQATLWNVHISGYEKVGTGSTARANSALTYISGEFNKGTPDWSLYAMALQAPAPACPISGYFNQGAIRFTTGPNAGAIRTVRNYENSTGAVTVSPPLEHIPDADDIFEIYPGCDKLLATCESKFDNAGNFRGMPFIPAPETAT